MNDFARTKLILLPPERIFPAYPFYIWLAGCIALAKGFIWPCQQNVTPGVFLFPLLVVFGVGIWNLRRWAFWGLLLTALLEMILYIFFPFYLLIDMHAGYKLGFYSGLFNLLSGPIGDGMILVSLVASYRLIHKPQPDRKKRRSA